MSTLPKEIILKNNKPSSSKEPKLWRTHAKQFIRFKDFEARLDLLKKENAKIHHN